jgi:hypothetical protein
MKRDMDLVRDLMLKLEVLPTEEGCEGRYVHVTSDTEGVAIAGKTAEEIDFHLALILDAGFVDGGDVNVVSGVAFRKLTWSGYDFLDTVRDAAIWRDTKEGAKKAGGFSVDLLVALGKGLIKKKIEQHTGVNIDI